MNKNHLQSNGISLASGIRFACESDVLPRIEIDMDRLFKELDIAPDLIVKKRDIQANSITYTLTGLQSDNVTLDFSERSLFHIRPDIIEMPGHNGKNHLVKTVSRKEILLALLQHGRLTVFRGNQCKVQILRDHIGIRQNTVTWAEDLSWDWPDGGRAHWNKKYWKRGTPKPGHPLHEAVADAFLNQSRYGIGCYTATKLVMLQGVLDYYHRVRKDPALLKAIEQKLLVDHEPLENVEPGSMWSFEDGFDPDELRRPGKLLDIQYGVASKNFVPGDWVYIVNTDPVTYQKTGYEGSNAIYLGGNRFDDYYNDNDHAYTFSQKLDEVHQWKNGVFSRSRDGEKIRALSVSEFEKLTETPSRGGLLLNLRVFPRFFSNDQGAY